MKLTDRLQAIAAEAKQIRESMSLHVPGPGFDPAFQMNGRERLLGRHSSSEWMAREATCAALIASVKRGDRPAWHLQEAMSTSDFPLLFGDLLYRQLLGNYVPYPVTYPGYFRIVECVDFRHLNLYTIDGGQSLFTNAQGEFGPLREYEPYPEIKFQEGRYQIQVAKYGRRYGISFEMIINDDLNAFAQRPAMMATGARRSEEYLATTMMCDANGPHASYFTAGNANIVTDNPPLSIPALQTAYAVLAAQKDKDSQPIVITGAHLVVCPGDEIMARNIMNATELFIGQSQTGETVVTSSTQVMRTGNWMRARVSLHVNPYIPYVASAATTAGYKPWFLIAEPNDMTQRPAFVFGFLRGRRNPQLFIQDSDQIMLGGGAASPMEGNFDNDAINYKLRHIFGAVQADPKMAVASSGAGPAQT
jgi:hypothetical protein